MSTNRPRTPAVVYTLISLLMVVVLATLALTSRQPPPPAIAEFAPQAVEQIADAPADQSSGSGASGGAGGSGADASPQTPAVQVDPVDVPRVRRCVGDPPRQIEDPQSPPCVPYWSGDNGGPTAKGVTRDEIRIAVVHWNETYPLLERFFNKRFEFYGRTLRLIQVGSDCPDDRAEAEAIGVEADEETDAFAATGCEGNGGFSYHTALARRGVVSAASWTAMTEAVMAANRPYLWQYPMAAETLFRATGTFACRTLAGRDAAYAGASEQGKPRRFAALIQSQVAEQDVSADPLLSAMRACGAEPAYVQQFTAGNRPDDQGVVLRMREAGVTSVICLCHVADTAMWVAQAASTQGFFPEWIVSSFGVLDADIWARTIMPQEQWAHAFGTTMVPKQVRAEQNPVWWAAKEADPAADPTGTTALDQWSANVQYRSLLLIASGVQMAGPKLTPTAFETGLQQSSFPNPENAIGAGKVGFANGSHAMTIDAGQIWWSSTAPSPYADGSGAFCYVQGGRRVDPPNWPDTKFFTETCDSGA